MIKVDENRVMDIRLQYKCSLMDAKRIVMKEALLDATKNAKSLEDVKEVVETLIDTAL